MDMMMSRDAAESPQLRADRRGYVLGEERVDGFVDRPDLDGRARLKIARWAARFAEATMDEQQRTMVAERRRPDEESLDILAGFAANAEEVGRLVAEGLYPYLTDTQQALVRDPAQHPKLPQVGYPLDVGEMSVLTGATARQLRHWNDIGIIPAERSGNRRLFYSAGLLRAMALVEADQYEKTAVGVVARGGQEGARLLRLVSAALLTTVAPRLADEAAEELANAAMTLMRNSKAVAELVPGLSYAPAVTSAAEVKHRVTADAAAHGQLIRYVEAGSSGQWAVRSDLNRRASKLYATKNEAVRAARAHVGKGGGGAVLVHNKNGKIAAVSVKGPTTRAPIPADGRNRRGKPVKGRKSGRSSRAATSSRSGASRTASSGSARGKQTGLRSSDVG